MANAKPWKLGRTEFAHAYGVGTPYELKAHVPKIMTLVPMGDKPEATKETLSKSCIINAKSCKPSIATNINTLNYMTIKCDTQVNGALVEKGTKVQLQVRNGSPDQVIVVPHNT